MLVQQAAACRRSRDASMCLPKHGVHCEGRAPCRRRLSGATRRWAADSSTRTGNRGTAGRPRAGPCGRQDRCPKETLPCPPLRRGVVFHRAVPPAAHHARHTTTGVCALMQRECALQPRRASAWLWPRHQHRERVRSCMCRHRVAGFSSCTALPTSRALLRVLRLVSPPTVCSTNKVVHAVASERRPTTRRGWRDCGNDLSNETASSTQLCRL